MQIKKGPVVQGYLVKLKQVNMHAILDFLNS